jgi:hypothetical protein
MQEPTEKQMLARDTSQPWQMVPHQMMRSQVEATRGNYGC